MAELLRDNVELGRRGEEGPTKPSRRAVPDLLSWVTCFDMYASIVAEKPTGEGEGALGVPNTSCAGGETLWWQRLAGL